MTLHTAKLAKWLPAWLEYDLAHSKACKMATLSCSCGASLSVEAPRASPYQHHHHGRYQLGSSSRSRLLHFVKPLRITAADEAAGPSFSKTISRVLPVLPSQPITLLAGVLLGIQLWMTPSSEAVDALKTCACLLKECRVELARCIADPACAANVACLQTCNNRPDETECQIGCGDIFENSVVDQFNECAVSRKKCVPQKGDEGTYPIPQPSALVQNFSASDFSGKWYISSGLNPTFDTFDCQLHEFSTSPNKFSAKLTWRIKTPDGGFFTRSALQNFVQDPKQPGIFYNHGNEFLHYQDDWYILSAKTENQADDYIFVYYKGRNDAWDGYGGAVVYTRSKVLPPSIVPELTAAAKKVGLDFNKFRSTDNTCGPEPPLLARLEKKVEDGEQALVQEVEEIEKNVVKIGKAEMTLLDKLKKGVFELKKDQEYLLQELGDEEKALLSDLKMEAEEVEKLFGKALPIRKLR
eukprot:c12321_g1_i1 orf=284-1687(-)